MDLAKNGDGFLMDSGMIGSHGIPSEEFLVCFLLKNPEVFLLNSLFFF